MKCDRGGGHVQISEEKYGNLQGMQGDDGSIFTPPPHGDISQDNHETHLGVGRWWRRARVVCGVLTTRVEISDVYGGYVPSKGTQTRKT